MKTVKRLVVASVLGAARAIVPLAHRRKRRKAPAAATTVSMSRSALS
jgi:hypothetical protein